MCYCCGCGIPDNDKGDKRHITDKTFIEAAKAAKIPLAQVKKNTLDLLSEMEENGQLAEDNF
ncbi:MAG: hypothetical protein M1514_04065 [Patescibacteria group bacterium]|nr:hypothetical protein [Patescibacteria group bacterium]